VELDFPHLPPGCSIQLDRQSREYVLKNIKENLRNLKVRVPDRLQTFTSETGQELTFGNFIRYHDYEPETLLVSESWSGWKAKAQLTLIPTDPDLARLKKSLVRAAFISGPKEVSLLRNVIAKVSEGAVSEAIKLAGDSAMSIYYRIWGDTGNNLGITSLEDAFTRLSRNPSILADLEEVLAWSLGNSEVSGQIPDLPFPCHGHTSELMGLHVSLRRPFSPSAAPNARRRGRRPHCPSAGAVAPVPPGSYAPGR
jgi:hypothetical protein